MSSCSICEESDNRLLVFCAQQHPFCRDCIRNYVLHTKHGVLPAKCPIPQCAAQMTLDGLMRIGILQGESLARCQRIQAEREALSGGRGFWCARRTCSELLLAPLDGNAMINTVLICQYCRLLHCWHCQSEWHDGLSCDEYQCLPDEAKRDMKNTGESALKDLASNKDWRRCQQCHVLVERSEGCNHMTCVCRYEFCYRCGSKWVPVPNNRVGKCSKNPPCPLFDDVADEQNEPQGHEHFIQNHHQQNQQQQQQQNQVPMRRIRNPEYQEQLNSNINQFLNERNFMSFSNFRDFIDGFYGNLDDLNDNFASDLQHNTCGYCDRSFVNLNGLFSHLRTTTSHRVFSCDCSLFDDYDEFTQHLHEEHFHEIRPNVPSEILVPDEAEIRRRAQRQQRPFNRDLNLNLRYLSEMYQRGHCMGYRRFFIEELVRRICPYCDRQFDTFGALENHLNTTRQHDVYVNQNGVLHLNN